MSFSIGIVGLPNVGKSTLFKAITKKQVPAENYPFCTIDPNVGVVAVPDPRLDKLAELSKSAKTIYTTIDFVDIAGLVKGASQGEGLGNKFLSHIREVDAIVQVMRQFSDKDVVHVAGKVDPEDDRQVINLELVLADVETLDKRLGKNKKNLNAQDKDAQKLQPILEKLKAGFDQGKLASEIITDEAERLLIKDMNLLTLKPMIYVLNVDEDKVYQDTDYLTISAKIEAELAELAPEDAKAMLAELKVDASGLDKLIVKAFDILGLMTFLTTGPQESRAWTIKKGIKAPQAAGVIHTDFEKKFVKAEVINWQDLLNSGSEAVAKEKGLMRLEGKDYVMQEGDVCHFKIGG